MVLRGLHNFWDTGFVTAEFSHQWRVLWNTIPQLDVIRRVSFTTNVHGEDGYRDICAIGLWDKVYTVCSWVCTRIQWWGEESTTVVIIATTFEVECLIFNLKTNTISTIIWLEPFYKQKYVLSVVIRSLLNREQHVLGL